MGQGVELFDGVEVCEMWKCERWKVWKMEDVEWWKCGSVQVCEGLVQNYMKPVQVQARCGSVKVWKCAGRGMEEKCVIVVDVEVWK